MLLVVMTACGAAPAGQDYFVAERYRGDVYRLDDLNGDGDALDAGEKTLWAEGLSQVIDLSRLGSNILAMDRGADRIVRLTDSNGDHDALDTGESVVWADGFSRAYGLSLGPAGEVYATEFSDNQVWRLVDANGDGDALDVAEKTLYAEGIDGAISVLARHGDVLVAAYSGDRVHRLVDVNGDSDALDVGEVVRFADGIDNPTGLFAGLGPGPLGTMITIQSGTGTLDAASPDFVAIVEQSTLDVRLIGWFSLIEKQEFAIINVDGSLSGAFDDMPAGGDLVGTFENVGLFIKYDGGDGNDVVLFTPAMPGMVGDLNWNRTVNDADLNLLLSNFGTVGNPWDYLMGDIDGNGSVDRTDLTMLLGNFGATVAPPLTEPPNSVPEPASWALAAAGIVGLLAWGRRRRKAQKRR